MPGLGLCFRKLLGEGSVLQVGLQLDTRLHRPQEHPQAEQDQHDLRSTPTTSQRLLLRHHIPDVAGCRRALAGMAIWMR